MKKLISSIFFQILIVFTFAQVSQDTTITKPSLTFIPEFTFEDSGIKDWTIIGDADWKVQNGEIIGSAKSGSSGGYLMLNRSFQDVGLRTLFKPDNTGELGILFRIEKINDEYKGILLSIKGTEVSHFQVLLDKNGKEKSRQKLRPGGGIRYRLAPPETEEEKSRRLSGVSSNPYLQPKISNVVPVERPNTDVKNAEWNQIEVFFDLNVIRSFLNDGREIGAIADDALEVYGPIALLVREGEVHFKDMGLKDLGLKETPLEQASSNFSVQRISDMYYSWGADAADFNNDGHLDIVSGPTIFYGPDFTSNREISPAISVSPSKEFTATHVQYTFDFNGDGWPDILTSPTGAVLFINPKNESKRWERYDVLKNVQTEITDFQDIDGDGIPELIYGEGGTLRYAKPDPSDVTKPWIEHIISEEGYSLAHGIGNGDINGDGRLDILNPYGWWEQPENLEDGKLWKYHPVAFGRYGHRSGGIGGSLMAVYDVNGDGLNDVVTVLNAHGFGLAWFEQKRDSEGNISFIRHMISDDYSVKSVGDVTFSQAHGSTFTDIDGDGIPDFIVGKRVFTHLDNYYDPDPYSPAVIYWYRTVRNPNAPGGAEFVPELIHNRSGAGSEITVKDLDGDGAMDIISATNRGTFIFRNTMKQD